MIPFGPCPPLSWEPPVGATTSWDPPAGTPTWQGEVDKLPPKVKKEPSSGKPMGPKSYRHRSTPTGRVGLRPLHRRRRRAEVVAGRGRRANVRAARPATSVVTPANAIAEGVRSRKDCGIVPEGSNGLNIRRERTMKQTRRQILSWVAAFVLLAGWPLETVAQDKTRIAVSAFENKVKTPWGDPSWKIGEGLPEMLTTELMKTGRFTVVERQAIGDVVREQELGRAA